MHLRSQPPPQTSKRLATAEDVHQPPVKKKVQLDERTEKENEEVPAAPEPAAVRAGEAPMHGFVEYDWSNLPRE